MTPEYLVYLNGNYFDTLLNSTDFGSRPEPYRLQEKKLWTIYQLSKLGEHEVIVTDRNRQVAMKTKSCSELKSWFEVVYPDFIGQLGKPVYSKFPHPQDSFTS